MSLKETLIEKLYECKDFVLSNIETDREDEIVLSIINFHEDNLAKAIHGIIIDAEKTFIIDNGVGTAQSLSNTDKITEDLYIKRYLTITDSTLAELEIKVISGLCLQTHYYRILITVI